MKRKLGREPGATPALPVIADPADRWGIAQAVVEGSPFIIRFNESAKGWRGHCGLPVKLSLAIPLIGPIADGLPDPAENAQLGDVEDVIVREVKARTRGVHALVLTSGEVKELVFYIPLDVAIAGIDDAIQQAVSTHEVQCIATHEPKWDTYKRLTPA